MREGILIEIKGRGEGSLVEKEEPLLTVVLENFDSCSREFGTSDDGSVI